jgi:hypothetical protein
MVLRRVAVVIGVGALVGVICGCSSLDARTESARKRILALDAGEAARIVTFCNSWRQQGALSVDQFPAALPVSPTSATAAGDVITFAWWNNSHREEDDAHPGFDLICSAHAIAGAKPIATGLWYRDAPMNRD